MFTIGHLRGRSTTKIFPIERNDEKTNIKILGHSGSGGQKGYIYDTSGNVGALTATDYKQPKQIMVVGSLDLPGRHESANRVYGTDGIAPCLNTFGGGGRETKIRVQAVLTPDRLNKRQNGRRFKESGEPMFTLTKQDIHGVMLTQKRIIRDTDIANTLTARNPSRSRGNNTPITGITDGTRIRRLTPKECWRLQGIPDAITEKVIKAGISDTQMYKGAGDATTVNVIYEIAKRMS